MCTSVYITYNKHLIPQYAAHSIHFLLWVKSLTSKSTKISVFVPKTIHMYIIVILFVEFNTTLLGISIYFILLDIFIFVLLYILLIPLYFLFILLCIVVVLNFYFFFFAHYSLWNNIRAVFDTPRTTSTTKSYIFRTGKYRT